jgi:hypothetical protein
MKEYLNSLGIHLGLMFAGLIGGLVFMNMPKNKKRPTWEKITIVLVGIACANYLTPLLIWLMNIPKDVQYGVSFLIGYMGLKGIGSIIDMVRNKIESKKK